MPPNPEPPTDKSDDTELQQGESSSRERAEGSWTKPGIRLRDARSLRAFAHPLRVALVSALRVHGPLTATQAAAIVDDSPSNCSFHLRTLASFGVIEDVPGGDARQRLWRVVRGGVSFEPGDDAESRVAAKAAADVFHQHTIQSLSRWIDREADAPKAWRTAWFDSTATVSVTADELATINAAIGEVIRPFVERRRSRPDQPGEIPVAITAFGYPEVMPPPDEPGTNGPLAAENDGGTPESH